FPEYWAMTQNNMAAAYYERIRGERGDNIEEAIAACQQALEVRTREAFPEQWAMTQNNLANAYCDRVRGERGENIEEAIAAYQRALEVRTREAFPEQWAQTQLNLGSAYRKKNETEQAIAAYKQAQEVYTREAFPEDWAKTQWGLANAYGDRDGDGDLDQAILLFQDVLTVTSYKTETFINANYLLGNLLNRRYDRHNNPEDLAAAERAYSTALDCIDPEHYDIEDYRNALPSVRAIMGGRLVRDGQWKKGLELLLTSLDELKDAKDDQAYANALYQTARAYEYEDNQPKARTYYRDALRLYQRLNNTLAIARTRYGLGNVLVNQGFPEKGKIELEAARELYQTLEKSDKVAECDQRLSSLCQTIEKLEAYDISAPESPPW
ncbi:MAG: tetratricopeptide repeat protein, partial [Cyanophyceae cyanobacterium]